MTLIDIVLVFIVLVGAIRGYIMGFLNQMAGILGLVVGLMLAYYLYNSVAEKLYATITNSMTVAQIAAFVGIWLIIPILFTLVASFFTHALEAVSLGWLNRVLGLGLGALKWIVILGLAINVFEYVDSDNTFFSKTKKEESVLYYPMKHFVGSIFPTVREVADDYISI
ncbi:CvpA family protein [Bacteroides sp. 214]|uniref:CvpA family protein n=1 Tax=Bacteroides sp. 214 TaxID=2302935 RepID=UPI0013D49AB0|nr:CvpA family protein [Bacteroides sp. 214]